jgi:protein-serine/threonine kinase
VSTPLFPLSEIDGKNETYRACRDVIFQLLQKDEVVRLGCRTGASEVKNHEWFRKIKWSLLRNMKPPVRPIFPFSFRRGTKLTILIPQIIPAPSNGIDMVNFRKMKDSQSFDLDGQVLSSRPPMPSLPSGQPTTTRRNWDESDYEDRPELMFDEFNSVTLHYDGE